MKKINSGQNIYGQIIGIIVLETRFPRIRGDIGNATTWDFPVVYKTVKLSSWPIREDPKSLTPFWEDPKAINPFIEAAQDLEKVGVKAITTSCGFLALFQKQIADAVNIPVFTSSLMQIPLVYSMLKSDQKVGIITVDSRFLTKTHLACVGADSVPTVIAGTEGEQEFSKVLRGNELTLDVEKARNDHIAVARRLISQHPEVGAIVLECTNMPPYAKSIQEELNLPVFDIYTLVNWVYSSLVRNCFTG